TEVEIDENQVLTKTYKSGVTSNTNGVMLSDRGNYLNAAAFVYHLGVSHDDIYLHRLPMFLTRCRGGVWAITAAGGTHVCLRKVDPPHILNLFEKHDVNLLCGAPTVINMLVNEPAAKEANITTEPRMGTAGAPPAAALIQKAQ